MITKIDTTTLRPQSGINRMSCRTTCLLATCLLFSGTALASPFYLGLGINTQSHDTSESDALDDSNALIARVGYQFGERLAVEIGARENIETEESGADQRGVYRLGIEVHDVTLGVALQGPLEKPTTWIARAGLVSSTVDVRLDETFYGVKPPATATTRNEDLGYYLELGLVSRLSPAVDLELAAGYLQRPHALTGLSGDISLADVSLGLGMNFHF